MSTLPTISKQELNAIRQSVLTGRLLCLLDAIGIGKVDRRASENKGIPKWVVEQDALLAQLSWSEGRAICDWSSSRVKSVIIDALDRNDHKFMTRLGRALCRPAKSLVQALDSKAERLKEFLLDHWVESEQGLPPLAFLAPSDAVAICSKCLGFDVDEAAYVKVRQRLKLRASRRKLYRLKLCRDGFKIVKVDKP